MSAAKGQGEPTCLHAGDHCLYAGIARLTRGLHEGLRELGLDSRLEMVAGSDIPDACARLDHVVTMTEAAAHRTLDLVEDGRAVADALHDVRLHLALPRPLADAAVQADALRSSRDAVAEAETRLREILTALAQAQEYQDLSGQLIRRVIVLVRNVESTLLELLGAGGLHAALSPGKVPAGLAGPALPGAGAANQDDADRLLAGLGF
jgi:chemotaxis protein CheZ